MMVFSSVGISVATGASGVPLWVWQAVGGLVGVLLIFGILVFIVQRSVIISRRRHRDSPPSSGD